MSLQLFSPCITTTGTVDGVCGGSRVAEDGGGEDGGGRGGWTHLSSICSPGLPSGGRGGWEEDPTIPTYFPTGQCLSNTRWERASHGSIGPLKGDLINREDNLLN